jgi:hypothetical protein
MKATGNEVGLLTEVKKQLMEVKKQLIDRPLRIRR